MSMQYRQRLIQAFMEDGETYESAVKSVDSLEPRALGHYDADAVSLASGLSCQDPSLADQSQKEEADINTIVERFGLTKQLPQRMDKLPLADEYIEPMDLQSAMNVVRRAQESFEELPGKIRAKFGNDPVAFSEFALNTENAAELQKMGLLVPREPDKVHRVEVANVGDLVTKEKAGESSERT